MLPSLWRNRGSLIAPSMEDFIEKFFYGWPGIVKDTELTWVPRVDVNETDKEIILDVEIPELIKKMSKLK